MDPSDVEQLGFEAALQRLEQAVEQVERGDLGLDEALARYQLGVRLLAHCCRLLNGAEQTIALVTSVDGQGNPQTLRFESSASFAAYASTRAPVEPDPEVPPPPF